MKAQIYSGQIYGFFTDKYINKYISQRNPNSIKIREHSPVTISYPFFLLSSNSYSEPSVINLFAHSRIVYK